MIQAKMRCLKLGMVAMSLEGNLSDGLLFDGLVVYGKLCLYVRIYIVHKAYTVHAYRRE